MPPLPPREKTRTASVILLPTLTGLPLTSRGSASPILSNEAVSRFTRVAACTFAVGNSRPLIAQTPLPRATEANGQLLGRDFNPLDKRLLLRTGRPSYLHIFKTQPLWAHGGSKCEKMKGVPTYPISPITWQLPASPATCSRIAPLPPSIRAQGGLFRKANHLARGALIVAANQKSMTVTAEHMRLAATELL